VISISRKTQQDSRDASREARIKSLGTLICSPSATRLWRIVCMAEQHRLIRARPAHQIAKMEAALLVRIHESQGH
jgi:hypothetical protein